MRMETQEGNQNRQLYNSRSDIWIYSFILKIPYFVLHSFNDIKITDQISKIINIKLKYSQ